MGEAYINEQSNQHQKQLCFGLGVGFAPEAELDDRLCESRARLELARHLPAGNHVASRHGQTRGVLGRVSRGELEGR